MYFSRQFLGWLQFISCTDFLNQHFQTANCCKGLSQALTRKLTFLLSYSVPPVIDQLFSRLWGTLRYSCALCAPSGGGERMGQRKTPKT